MREDREGFLGNKCTSEEERKEVPGRKQPEQRPRGGKRSHEEIFDLL